MQTFNQSLSRVLREVNHFGNGIISVVEFGGIAGYDQSGSDFARFFPWARRPGSPLRERVGSTFSLNAPARPGRGARRIDRPGRLRYDSDELAQHAPRGGLNRCVLHIVAQPHGNDSDGLHALAWPGRSAKSRAHTLPQRRTGAAGPREEAGEVTPD